MKVAAAGLPGAIRAELESWGWQLTEDRPDALLSAIADNTIEIRVTATVHADDVAFLPLKREELTARIETAKARRARMQKCLHDLRSPLNAIQGYAEIIAETAEGDALRFASNIRTASELLTSRLEKIRDDGV
jgi:signal transduction histidine kinase